VGLLYFCTNQRGSKLTKCYECKNHNQDEFENWLKALDMYELIDWLLPEVLEEEFNVEMYNYELLSSPPVQIRRN